MDVVFLLPVRGLLAQFDKDFIKNGFQEMDESRVSNTVAVDFPSNTFFLAKTIYS